MALTLTANPDAAENMRRWLDDGVELLEPTGEDSVDEADELRLYDAE